MATEIRVPTLGESVSEATIGKWFRKPGEAVKADEPLVELETDKVTLEVNAPAAGVLNYRRIELLREIMVAYGDQDTPVYVTEAGWNDHPRWTMAVRPGQRIDYTLEALDLTRENMPYVRSVALWAFRYPVPTRSYPDYYTLVSPEFVAKPFNEALRSYSGN